MKNQKTKGRLQGAVAGLIAGAIIAGGGVFAANTVRIVIDGKELVPKDVNGNIVNPIIIDGTTYLPVRAVAGAVGKAVYWDGETSTVYLGDTGGKLPYPTTKLMDMKNIGSGWNKTNKLTDNYGNYYSNALTTWHSSEKGQYLLNGKYNRLKGTLYVAEGDTSINTCGFVITADGKDIYKSPAITKTSYPIDVDISVKGCNVLEISHTGDYFELYFGDAGLYQ